ncbi:hypothetical protein M427DRAFT_221481 [Gonapodya prolifera JEL478]|uniref:Uncharacterized protein n=1 Tax=Gonapodya prolifera (strain JEL478) TaxID=1344416 RepID=A0A139AMU0_GONPJ|nr:hypothetical protein M427DRAFT_221481 [Gonapodya prolifera JEL478]|eukprot:KXS18071.1 hypothetical protein M427DRAFT_221481 [Gonapodya prolifera JEL478]
MNSIDTLTLKELYGSRAFALTALYKANLTVERDKHRSAREHSFLRPLLSVKEVSRAPGKKSIAGAGDTDFWEKVKADCRYLKVPEEEILTETATILDESEVVREVLNSLGDLSSDRGSFGESSVVYFPKVLASHLDGITKFMRNHSTEPETSILKALRPSPLGFGVLELWTFFTMVLREKM